MTKGIHPKLESISIPNQEQTHKHKVHCETKVSCPNNKKIEGIQQRNLVSNILKYRKSTRISNPKQKSIPK